MSIKNDKKTAVFLVALKFTVANKVGSIAINVGQRRISFAFNLVQFYTLIVGRAVYKCGPLKIQDGCPYDISVCHNNFALQCTYIKIYILQQTSLA